MNKAVLKMATMLFQIERISNTKHEVPAFAEAASRRQAKFETISNDQISNVQNKLRFWEI
jgi:hypothetical protein